MTVIELSEMAKTHWKLVNPEVYQQMMDNGDLDNYVEASAKLVLLSMGTPQTRELSIAEAWKDYIKTWIQIDPGKIYNSNRLRPNSHQ